MGKATSTAAITLPGCSRREKMRKWWGSAGHAGSRMFPKKALPVNILKATTCCGESRDDPIRSVISDSPLAWAQFGIR